MFPSNIRTGFDILDNDPLDNADMVMKIKLILKHYMVDAVTIASAYCNESGRNALTCTDIEYALKYQAHEFVIDDKLLVECEKEYNNSKTKSKIAWADVVEDSDDDDVEDSDDDDENDDDEFSRCESTNNELIVKMNKYYDEWGAWIPTNDLHVSIKKSIDKVFFYI